MVDVWELNQWREEILTRWNEINLYTMTRGINRFKGLAIALSEINEKYTAIEDISSLTKWADTSPELSNATLERAIEADPDSISLRNALRWSQAVNESITMLPEECKLPFPKAREALDFAHGKADIAIVSSANLDAVLEEWEKFGLLEHTDIVLAQNAGSKAFCISELLKKGYNNKNVVMCGDAPGDLKAAESNNIHFFPILVKNEEKSWQDFINQGFSHLLDCSYEEYETIKKRYFYKNLGAK